MLLLLATAATFWFVLPNGGIAVSAGGFSLFSATAAGGLQATDHDDSKALTTCIHYCETKRGLLTIFLLDTAMPHLSRAQMVATRVPQTHLLLLTFSWLCLACICSGMNATSVTSGAFRAATLTWRRVAPNIITASLVLSWSTDHSAFRSVAVGDVVEVTGISSPVLRFGDGRSTIVSSEVVSVNAQTSSFTGIFAVNITYAASSGSRFALEFSGCCRSSYLTFGAQVPFNVTAQVDLLTAASPPLTMLPRLQVQPLTRISVAFADLSPGGPRVRIYFPAETTGLDEQSLLQRIQHQQSSFLIPDASNDVIFSLPLASITYMRLCSTFNDFVGSPGWLANSCSDIEIECVDPATRLLVDASSMSSITPPGPPSMLERFEGFDASYIVRSSNHS